MSGGAPGTWNRHVFFPNVLYNPDSARYEMWFGASDGPPNWFPSRIGFAVSDDGITWTRRDTAVLEPDPGEWDESTVEGSMVIRENGQYKMWYTGWRGQDPSGIGYATSQDGITWTKDPNNPIMGPGTAAWEAGGPAYCTVLPVPGEGYKMWYTGYNQSYDSPAIGYATSSNGITWQRDNLINPVLTTGSSGEWDDEFIYRPIVLFLDGTYYMWYTGNYMPTRAGGLAFSLDGIIWVKHDDSTTTNPPYAESDPVLKPSPGQWDRSHTAPGTVMLISDTLHMWYNGGREPTGTYLWRIGHATSPYITVGIDDYTFSGTLDDYVLSQNYPNPFNPSTTIEFDLPKTSAVTLKIFNTLGEDVGTLVSDRLSAGSHSYEWDASNMASGVYIYRLEAGYFVETKKMVLMR